MAAVLTGTLALVLVWRVWVMRKRAQRIGNRIAEQRLHVMTIVVAVIGAFLLLYSIVGGRGS